MFDPSSDLMEDERVRKAKVIGIQPSEDAGGVVEKRRAMHRGFRIALVRAVDVEARVAARQLECERAVRAGHGSQPGMVSGRAWV